MFYETYYKHCQRHNAPEGWVHITKSQFTVHKFNTRTQRMFWPGLLSACSLGPRGRPETETVLQTLKKKLWEKNNFLEIFLTLICNLFKPATCCEANLVSPSRYSKLSRKENPSQLVSPCWLSITIRQWCMSIRDWRRYQIGWIFGKNPIQSPPHFRKIMLQFFSENVPKKALIEVWNLQHKFLDFN